MGQANKKKQETVSKIRKTQHVLVQQLLQCSDVIQIIFSHVQSIATFKQLRLVCCDLSVRVWPHYVQRYKIDAQDNSFLKRIGVACHIPMEYVDNGKSKTTIPLPMQFVSKFENLQTRLLTSVGTGFMIFDRSFNFVTIDKQVFIIHVTTSKKEECSDDDDDDDALQAKPKKNVDYFKLPLTKVTMQPATPEQLSEDHTPSFRHFSLNNDTTENLMEFPEFHLRLLQYYNDGYLQEHCKYDILLCLFFMKELPNMIKYQVLKNADSNEDLPLYDALFDDAPKHAISRNNINMVQLIHAKDEVFRSSMYLFVDHRVLGFAGAVRQRMYYCKLVLYKDGFHFDYEKVRFYEKRGLALS